MPDTGFDKTVQDLSLLLTCCFFPPSTMARSDGYNSITIYNGNVMLVLHSSLPSALGEILQLFYGQTKVFETSLLLLFLLK